MLPCVCSVKDHRRRQNVVRTSVTHSAIASCATFLFLPHFDVICDLLLNRRTATWNLFVKSKVMTSLLDITMIALCHKGWWEGAGASLATQTIGRITQFDWSKHSGIRKKPMHRPRPCAEKSLTQSPHKRTHLDGFTFPVKLFVLPWDRPFWTFRIFWDGWLG